MQPLEDQIADWLMTDFGYLREDAKALVRRCRDWLAKEGALAPEQRRSAKQLADLFHYHEHPPEFNRSEYARRIP